MLQISTRTAFALSTGRWLRETRCSAVRVCIAGGGWFIPNRTVTKVYKAFILVNLMMSRCLQLCVEKEKRGGRATTLTKLHSYGR